MLLVLGATLGSCWGGPHIATLEAPTLPPPLVIVMTMTPGDGPVPLTITAPATVALETVAVTPEISLFCTTDGVNLRSDATTDAEVMANVGPRTTVRRLGTEERQANGLTWYNVEVDGAQGWMAAGWLALGDCNAAVMGGETPTIIDGATDDYGNTWLDEGANTEHFGVDFSSTSGNNSIQAPYSGSVVDSDACESCTEDSEDGNTVGEFDAEYNYGYGAMTIVEFRYEDLSEADRTALVADGVALEAGESLYMMVGHLDPQQTIVADGEALDPGEVFATIGNSGNSTGAHAHVEAAINDSGLAPGEDQDIADFWFDDVVERVYGDEEQANRQGNRFDPTPLFDVP